MLASNTGGIPAQEEEPFWATDAETLRGQTEWYRGPVPGAKESYEIYLQECDCGGANVRQKQILLRIPCRWLLGKAAPLLFTGAYLAAEGLLCDELEEGLSLPGGKGRKCYRFRWTPPCGKGSMEQVICFYANECLTDMKQTAWVLAA